MTLSANKALALMIGLLLALVLSACASGPDLKLAPLAQLRDDLREQPDIVRESYQLALANPEVLSKIPCYCGCIAIHKNVKDCFVREVKPDGTVIWDNMGIGCRICQDTVQDVRRLTRAGKGLVEIRADIDRTYSRFGPATDTAPVLP